MSRERRAPRQIGGHPQRLRALARHGRQFRATTCPAPLLDGTICGHTLYSEASRPAGRRRVTYSDHLTKRHPELDARARSVLADRMLRAETDAVVVLKA